MPLRNADAFSGRLPHSARTPQCIYIYIHVYTHEDYYKGLGQGGEPLGLWALGFRLRFGAQGLSCKVLSVSTSLYGA